MPPGPAYRPLSFPGVPNAQTRFPAELVVDYVRVYDKVGGYGAPAPRGPGVMPWEPGHVQERRFRTDR